MRAMRAQSRRRQAAAPNFQIQVLSTLFFRNKGAYIVGKIINGFSEMPFALPILHNRSAACWCSTPCCSTRTNCHAAVQLRARLLHGRHGGAVGLRAVPALADAAQAARRDLHASSACRSRARRCSTATSCMHLRAFVATSFRIAPGIKGMVMLVFDAAVVPVCVQGDQGLLPAAEGHHARADQGQVPAGQAARPRRAAWPTRSNTRNVAFPLARFDDELIAELQQVRASRCVEDEGDELVIRHLYIERRMMPLNIFLQRGGQPATTRRRARRRSNTATRSRTWSRANIFPGDMLYKNFGVTRHGRVVFYDYDEIEYLTDCNFRKMPAPRNEEDEMSGEPWYPVGAERRLPRDRSALPARQPGGAQGLPEAPRRPARRRHSGKAHKQRILAGYVRRRFPVPAAHCASSYQHQRDPARATCRLHPSYLEELAHERSHRHRRRRPHADGRPSQGDFSVAFRAPSSARSRSRPRSSAPASTGELVDEVLFGNCLMAGQGQAPARQAALKAGLPQSAGAVTLSKMCGSAHAARRCSRTTCCMAGSADVMVAGGMESMTNAPLPDLRRRAAAIASATAMIYDHMMLDGLEDAYEATNGGGVDGHLRRGMRRPSTSSRASSRTRSRSTSVKRAQAATERRQLRLGDRAGHASPARAATP